MADDFKYDVAVSFLHRDEPLALHVCARLQESLSAFVYSKKQENLAGTNGLESFREAFLTESRVVVVLFRKGWGETPWTRVEQAAITDRFLQQGWDFLLFVSIDDADTPPRWLPKTEIRLSFQQYGLEQMLGAIKVRVQKLGGSPRRETAVERAKRFQAESHARAKREQLLEEQGSEAFRRLYQDIFDGIERVVAEANEHLTDFEIQFGFEGSVFTLRSRNVSVNMYPHSTYPITDARIVVQEFDGPLTLPQEQGTFYIREPKVVSTEEFFFDYQNSHEWCWHTAGSVTYLNSREVAELVVEKLLELQERFDKLKIRRDRFE